MKAGDRVAMTLHDGLEDRDVMCVAIEGSDKSTIMLIDEDGCGIATIKQFWRKTVPMPEEEPKNVALTGGKPVVKSSGAYVERVCNANGCGQVYQAKKSDIARGWGLCCSKSCAAAYRSQK